MKIVKPTAILISLCLILSGCSFIKKTPAEDGNIISGEGNLSANIEIIEEIPESSEESSSEPEPEEAETVIENEIGSLEELSPYFQEFANLKSDQVPWGPGTNFDSTGKPVACVGLQAEYSKWAADFLYKPSPVGEGGLQDVNLEGRMRSFSGDS